MPIKDRQDIRRLADDVWIFYRRSSAHPVEYAIMLRVRRDSRWHTIHLFDNAHGVDEHHEHRYVGTYKQPPLLIECDTNTAMAAAMRKLRMHWREIVEAWERT